jgi:cytidine deaminase
MEKRRISFDLLVFDSLDELSQSEKELMQIAIEARGNAYAPYSQFMVGAAVHLANGEIVIGSNQENASFPSGLCAERVAVFQAGAKYPNVAIDSIAISVSSKTHKVDKPAAPCGNCRQAIAEYEQKQNTPISILMMGVSGKIFKCESLKDILPLAFGSSYLK